MRTPIRKEGDWSGVNVGINCQETNLKKCST